MRSARCIPLLIAVPLIGLWPLPATAQSSETESRQATVEQVQAAKSTMLAPYTAAPFERVISRFENTQSNGVTSWHPFFQNSYSGGGFAPGIGYAKHVSSYSTVDVRGSVSIRNYKLAEAEFASPRLFDRRGELSIVGGWKDATQVGFYGIGMNTSSASRADFAFAQPYAGARLNIRPTRRLLTLSGGADVVRWSFKSPTGVAPPVDSVFTPESLPGLGATTTYLHSQGSIAFDWRPAAGYARRGGVYGITAHDYTDNDSRFGFRRVDYQATQHIPLVRETWVISLSARASTTWNKNGQDTPFYLLPSLGGGSNLRGYTSWRFRDQNALLLQGEWRIMVNRYLDTAVFYDAGKVAPRAADLTVTGLKHDYGFGARFHTPLATMLRIDIARSIEGTTLVFATSAPF
jgi:surface antigen Omp85-like protein